MLAKNHFDVIGGIAHLIDQSSLLLKLVVPEILRPHVFVCLKHAALRSLLFVGTELYSLFSQPTSHAAPTTSTYMKLCDSQ